MLVQQSFGLLGGVLVTLFMGVFYLAQNGVVDTRPWDGGVENLTPVVYPTVEPVCVFTDCRPKLPPFLHPRVTHITPPELLCEVPGEPDAVEPCDALLKQTPASPRGSDGN
jgi:hypothetical protein